MLVGDADVVFPSLLLCFSLIHSLWVEEMRRAEAVLWGPDGMRAGWGDDRRKKQRGGETRRKEGDERGGERERSTYLSAYVDTCKEWGLISVYMVYFLLHAIKTCKYMIIRGSSATLAQQRNLCSAWVCVGLTGSQCLSISQWFKANNFILLSLFAQCCLLENKRC